MTKVPAPLPKTVAAYYRKVPKTHKKVMFEMRNRIIQIAPNSEELINYGMPAFRLNGNFIAGIMAHKSHIGYYPFSGSTLKNFKNELKDFKTTKSAIHVPLDKPLSKSLIRKLIRSRISQCKVAQGKANLSRYEALDAYWRRLGVAAPARRGLIDNKVFDANDLRRFTRDQLKSIHGIGNFALKVITKDMKNRKIGFKSR